MPLSNPAVGQPGHVTEHHETLKTFYNLFENALATLDEGETFVKRAGAIVAEVKSAASSPTRDGWTLSDDLVVGAARYPHTAMRAETLTGNFVAKLGTAPLGRSAILDIKKYTGGTGVGVTIFANAGARPTFAAGSKTAVIGALAITSLAAGDTLVPEVIQTGLIAAAQTRRLIGSNDSGTTSTGSAAIPIDVATTAGEKLVCVLVMGGATGNPTPFPLTLPSGWDQVVEVSGGTFGLNLAVLVKDAVANEPTGQTITFALNAGAVANRPWSIGVIGVTNSEPGVAGIENEAGAYTANATAAVAPESMPTTNNDFNGLTVNFFAMRATDPDATVTGHVPTVSGTPHESFIELVDRDSNRVDLANVAVEISVRDAIIDQAATTTTERTLTLTGTNATFNVIAGTLVVKRAGGAPGADLTLDIELAS